MKRPAAKAQQNLADLEERRNLILERRKRLADSDRAENQEAILAARRLEAIMDMPL